MDIYMDVMTSAKYKSVSQIARVVSEDWIEKNLYCPRCGYGSVEHLKNNLPVADFQCPDCGNIFESKASSRPFGTRVMDGVYDTMIQRIHEETNPDFLFMQYDRAMWEVRELLIVPKYYFHDSLIEKRPPLSKTARRAGWVGCNILLGDIPVSGRIPVISLSVVMDKEVVVRRYKETSFMARSRIQQRGWLIHMMQCLDKIKAQEFSLSDVYSFTEQLRMLHPENHHIEAKIRQQLQILRDEGILEFVGRGRYRKRI